jgi:hypothetical protein
MRDNSAFIGPDGRAEETAGKPYKNAKRATKAINVLGFIVTLWAVFLPVPYIAAIISCLILPLICVYVMASAKGLVNLNAPRRSKEPNVAIAFVGPCIALCFRAVFDFQFISYERSLAWGSAMGLALTFLTYANAPDLKQKWLNLLVVLPFALAYGYGFFLELNCLPDSSKPSVYTTRIVNRRISNGNRGGKYYYLDILPCGPLTKTQEVRVSRRKYEIYSNYQQILLLVRNGTLGAEWFYIAPMMR